MVPWKIPAGALALAAAAGAAALMATRLRRRNSELHFSSRFGPARIYEVQDDAGEAVRLLEVNGIVQSGTYLDGDYTRLAFQYLKDYDLMFQTGRPIHSVCVLGCGGYDYPEHLIAEHPELFVTAVEIDPAITAAARAFFFLDRLWEEYELEESGRLELVQADALDYLEQPGRRFDAIVNDAFDGGAPPTHLTTTRFYRAIRNRLEGAGMYLANIVAPLSGPGSSFLAEQAALLRTLFEEVYLLPCDKGRMDEPDNIIVVATDWPLPEALASRAL